MTTEARAGVRPLDLDLASLAARTRSVVGGDHAVVVSEDGLSRVVAGGDGLSTLVTEALELLSREAALQILEREFAEVDSAEAIFEGECFGIIYVLKQTSGRFDKPALLSVFAAQAALALALARRPSPEPAPAELLAELDDLVLRAGDLRDLCLALTRALAPHFAGARVGVMVADGQAITLQQMPGSFGADGEVTSSHRVSVFEQFSNSARVFTTGLPYLSNHTEGDRGIRQGYVEALELRQLMTVPLRNVGVLHIADKGEPFVIEDVELALALAPRIANILALGTMMFHQRRQQRLEEILTDMAVRVASGAATGDSVVPALEELCVSTDANLVAIVSGDGVATIARSGIGHPGLEGTVLDEADTEPGIRAYVIGPKNPGDPGWAAFYVPILLGHQRIGTLAAFRNRGEPFAQNERRSLVRMANLAALARAAERYQQQRAELARAHERQLLADDLHDDVAQILFAAQMSLDAILVQEDELGADVATAVKRSRGLLVRGDIAIRTVINRLSPPSATDLSARLSSVVSGVEDEFSTPVHLRLDEDALAACEALRLTVADALVRVARESLVNAAKHAGPCSATLTLKIDAQGDLALVVADDGRGEDALGGVAGGGHGLPALERLIQDQGGALIREPVDAGGTRVTATVPRSSAQAPPAVDGA